MSRSVGAFLLAVSGLLLAVCVVRTTAATTERESTPPGRPAAERANDFAIRLYKECREREGNLVVSPFSLYEAMGMVWCGAGGQTAEELARLLSLPADRSAALELMTDLRRPLEAAAGHEGFSFLVANALWGQQDVAFHPKFLEVVGRAFGGALERVDFVGAPENARRRINGWTEEKTQGRIKNLVPPGSFNPYTRLVATNAVYFKGPWAKPFEPFITIPQPFHVSAAETGSVPMMRKIASFPYGETEKCQVLEMRYAEEQFSMVFVLPKTLGGLSELEEKLEGKTLDAWLSSLGPPAAVEVDLPRFTFGSSLKLRDALRGMGASRAFDLDLADFGRMSTVKPLFLSEVLHKAFVVVDEKGTEAAAATAVVGVSGGPAPTSQRFRADHPFLFFMRHAKTGALLFVGRVTNPLDTGS